MSRRNWTSYEVRILRDMLEERATAKEIAKELNRSMGSIAGKINRTEGIQGTEGRPPNINRMMYIMDMIELGLSLHQIARNIGVKKNSVRRIVVKFYKEGLVELTGPRNCLKYVVSKKWKEKD